MLKNIHEKKRRLEELEIELNEALNLNVDNFELMQSIDHVINITYIREQIKKVKALKVSI